MKRCIIPVLLCVCAPLCFAASKPAVPEIPEVLKPAKAAISNRAEFGGLTLSLSSPTPLTDEQWSAIESLKIRAFSRQLLTTFSHHP